MEEVEERMSGEEKVSKAEWQRRAVEMTNDNVRLQMMCQKCVEDMIFLGNIATQELEKTRLLIMPGVQATLKKVQDVAAPYAAVKLRHLEAMKAKGDKSKTDAEIVQLKRN